MKPTTIIILPINPFSPNKYIDIPTKGNIKITDKYVIKVTFLINGVCQHSCQ